MVVVATSSRNRSSHAVAGAPLARRVAHRRAGLLLGAAALTLALGATDARAACAPDPVAANTTVICTDSDTDGFATTFRDTFVVVNAGATVNAGDTSAISFSDRGRLNVFGTVDGGATADGVRVGGGDRLRMFIGQAGVVTGRSAIIIPDGATGRLDIENAGRIEATGETAIDLNGAPGTYIDTLRNRATGRIVGTTLGLFRTVVNDGLMDGRDSVALFGALDAEDSAGQVLINNGIMTAATSNQDLEAAVMMSGRIINNGRIESRGNGSLIFGEELDISNNAGAVIRGAAGQLANAITVDRLSLTNAGLIEGAVRASGPDNSEVYQRAGGELRGNVIFGSGNDLFLVEARGDAPATTGVTGTIEGGDGTDGFGYRFTASGSVIFPDLPTGFENYMLDLCGCDVSVTVADRGTVYTNGLSIKGEGEAIINASFNATGTVLAVEQENRGDIDGDSGLAVTNRGTLTGTLTEMPGLVVSAESFTNEGVINISNATYNAANADAAANVVTTAAGGFVNSGTIEIGLNRDDAGLSRVGLHVNGNATNSGTIHVNNATLAVEVRGGTLNNSGTISSTQTSSAGGIRRGVLLEAQSRLVNSGTIDNAPGGAFTLLAYDDSTIVNLAGGHVVGGVRLVGAALDNAGTIDGAVTGVTGENQIDIVHLAQGSTVNGNVSLGGGDDILIIDASRIDQTGRTGAIDASGIVAGSVDMEGGTDQVWLQATQSRSMHVLRRGQAITGVANADDVVYEAAGEGTVLTLVGPQDNAGTGIQSIERTLRVAGDGTVVLDTDVAVASLVDGNGHALQAVKVEQGSTAWHLGTDGVPEKSLDLVIAATVNGTGGATVGGTEVVTAVVDASAARSLTLRADEGEVAGLRGTLVEAGSADVLIESGAQLRVGQTGTAAVSATALYGSGEIVNRGTIFEIGDAATGGAGDNNRDSVGVVLQIGGTLRNERTASGVTPSYRGNISMNGNAVVMEDATTLVNGSDIFSTNAAAVRVEVGEAVIVNGGRGVIRRGISTTPDDQRGVAIEGDGDSVVYLTNAATIQGSVSLTGGGNLVVSAVGGSVTGDVTFGNGNDTFLLRGRDDTGVAGTLTAGGGTDAYGRSFTSGADNVFELAKPGEFEMFGVQADGSETRVALTSVSGISGGVRMFGNGTIENRASITTSGTAFEVAATPGTPTPGLRVINAAGTVVNAASGLSAGSNSYLASFENAGTINATGDAVFVENVGGSDAPFRFINASSGVLAGGAGSVHVGVFGDVSASNAGVIRGAGDGQVSAYFRAAGGTAEVSNSGRIEAKGADSTALVLSGDNDRSLLTNSGEIVATGVAGVGVRIGSNGAGLAAVNPEDCLPSDTPTPQVVLRFDNSGTVRVSGGGRVDAGGMTEASVAVALDAREDGAVIELNNNVGGVIEATGANAIAIGVQGGGGSEIHLHQFKLVNAGTISGTGATTTAGFAGDPINLFELSSEYGQLTAAGAIQTLGTIDDITNTGTIIGGVDLGAGDDVFRAGGTIAGDVRLGAGDDTFTILAGLDLTGTVYGDDGFDRVTVELSGNVRLDHAHFVGFEQRAARVGPEQVATISGDATAFDTIVVEGGTLNVAAGAPLQTATATTITGSDTTNDRVNVAAGGGVAGAIDLRGGNDVVTNAGTIGGDVRLGGGDDRYVAAGGTVAGVIDGGVGGNDSFEFRLTADTAAAPTGIANFESLAARGAHRLTLTVEQDYQTLELLGGADLVLNAGGGAFAVTTILGDDSANDVVLNTPVAGRIALGGGDDTLTLTLGGTLGAIDGGSGSDTLNATLTTATTLASLAGFETANFAGAAPVTLTGSLAAGQTLAFDDNDNSLILTSGAELFGTVNGGAGRDVLTLETAAPASRTLVAAQLQGFEDLVATGTGTVALTGQTYGFQTVEVSGGHLTLGAGTALAAGAVTFDGADNVLTLASGATLTGPVDGGLGTDTLAFVQGQGTARDLGSLNYSGFERLNSSGAGELRIDRHASFDSVALDGGTTTVVAGATLTAPVTGGTGADTLAVLGTLAGSVDLGAGDDRLVVAAGDSVSGSRTGGTGTDTLEFRTSGSYEAPTVYNGQGFDSFEGLAVAGGVLSLTGDTAWTSGVAVTGGRLIGQAGTTLTSASPIQVARGATFGSAGTVNADLQVSGTLSPGASPGTMTVNGNVSFAAGSNLLLEVTSASGSDLLAIAGALTIADGAAVDITGALANIPGSALDLVIAQGGITGRFTTINKSPSVFGFVAQTGNRLQLRGEFQTDAALPTNVQASIAYANAVLRSGQMVQAFTGALPVLVDATGNSNAQAFQQLTPEAYGSAMLLGVEQGLTLVDTTRAFRLTQSEHHGWYGFAQGLAAWGDLDGVAGSGAVGSDIDTTGLIGGVGYGFEQGQVGAFVGQLNSDQALSALGATNKADGLAVGVYGDYALAGVGLHATVAWSGGEVATSRSLAVGGSARSTYDLTSLVADVSADYRFSLGTGFSLTPKLGLTYLVSEREAVSEGGATPFALSVDNDSRDAWFADAGVTLSGTSASGGLAVQPYAEAGLRRMLDAKGTQVSGRFVGQSGTLVVAGGERDETVARLGAGFGLDLTKGVRLHAGYAGEFGDDTRHSLTGGLSVTF